MDYREKYETAIKQAKEELKACGDLDCDAARQIFRFFPELKESEDERIRKWLIEMVEELREANPTNTEYNGRCSDAIAWLEKHGKNSMGISEATKQELEDNLNKALEKETPESCNEFLDEQKPADKVEPSIFKDRLLELFQIFRWRCKDHILTNGEILEYVDAHIQELIGTMQKPAAWSEEDESRITVICTYLQDYARLSGSESRTIRINEYCDWLKSHKERTQPQPEQEWSKEDKKMLEYAIDIIEWYSVVEKSKSKRVSDWLKSFEERYTWKPSEEQMKALDSAIHCYAGISPTNNREVYALEIMKEQLLKLREE